MRYTKAQIVAIGLGLALLALQTWLLLEHAVATPGHSLAMLAAVPVVSVTLAALPVLIEHCLRTRALLKAAALAVLFGLLVGYSLPQAIGRSAEARDTKIAEAVATARPLKMMLDELDTARKRVEDAAGEVKRESRDGGCKSRCEGWKRTQAERQARVDQLVGDIAKLAPPKIGASDAPRIAAVLGISEATVNLYAPLFLPVAIEVGVWVLLWFGFSLAPSDAHKASGAAIRQPAHEAGPSLVACAGAGRAPEAQSKDSGHDLEAEAVMAALAQAQRPVTNDELAEMMGVSKGEASKRVTALAGRVNKQRVGRHVAITLH